MVNLLAAIVMIGSCLAVNEDVVTLPGSIKPVTSTPGKAGQPFISRETLTAAESDSLLRFEVTLKMRNFSQLQARLGRGEQISPTEMAREYEPRADEYQAVLDWLTDEGFTITRRDSRHLSIFAQGTIAGMARAFDMKFSRVTFNGTECTAAITPPSVPAEFVPWLVGINGLQPWQRRH